MFPSVKTRFATAARRGFDVALEFATLGEYRLPAEPALPDPARVRAGGLSVRAGGLSALASRLESRVGGLTVRAGQPNAPVAGPVAPSAAEPRTRVRATRLRPATAAARRLRPEAPPQRISARTGVRILAFDARSTEPRRGPRTRGGSASARPQPCLVGDPGASGATPG
jgi:hypothetical protein